jgi:glycolate dehydrogenase FAD-linked subunit
MRTTRPSPTRVEECLAQLRSQLGAQHVVVERAEREFYAQDVHGRAEPPLAVVRPGSVDELVDTVRAVCAAGLAIVPRGGGMSYTDGYLPARPESVTVDLLRLDRIVEINAEDRYVTVECGATWKQLHDALALHGLRTPYWGPLSGLRSTVGGALSQGSMFLGSGLYGPVQESLLGLEVVLADGTLARVGAAANGRGMPFFRHYGPDLSGLFTGDCGAMGIKARATLRLIRPAAEARFLSYECANAADLFAAMTDIAREGIVSECFAFDPGLQAVRLKRTSLAADVQALGSVMKSAGGLLSGLKAGARVVAAGRSFLAAGTYSLHVSLDGRDAADADARARIVRRLVGARGREVENTIPKVMRANPFTEVNSMLGPSGERWVPVHGTVPFSRVLSMYEACEAVAARHRADIERFDIDRGYLIASLGTTGILIEPVFYWPDARQAFHERVLDARYLAKLTTYPENLPARDAVCGMRREMAELFMRHGAASFQIGKFYPYQAGLDPTAAGLLAAVKSLLDPDGLMNPGSLGLAE